MSVVEALRTKARDSALFVGVAMLGLVLTFHPALFSGFRLMMTDPGDTRFVQYVLEHSFLWATRTPGHTDFWSAPFFHPTSGVMAYSETLLGTAPIYWLLRLLRLVPDVAFPLWQMALFALNFAAMGVLLRKSAGLSRLAAAAGAFVFSFGAPRVNQLFHVQMIPQSPGVFAVVAFTQLHQARGRKAWLWSGLTGLGLAGELFSSFYAGWFFGFGVLLMLVATLPFSGLRGALFGILRAHGWKLLAAGALTALAVSPMVLRYLAAGAEIGFRKFPEVDSLSVHPASWFYLGSNSWLYGATATKKVFVSLTNEHEQRLGLGIVTPLAMLAGFMLARRKLWAWPLLLGGVLLIVFATHWSKTTTPWRYVFKLIPGAKGIRAESRVGELLLFVVAFGVAGAVEWLSVRRHGQLFAGVLLALIVAEQGMTQESFDVRLREEQVMALAHAVGPTCESFYFATLSGWQKTDFYQLDAMWASLQRGVPTLNGYSGWTPKGYKLDWNNLLSRQYEEYVHAVFVRWSQTHALTPDKTCWVELPSSDIPKARFERVRLEGVARVGAPLTVRVRAENDGLQTWHERDQFRLALAQASEAAGWTMEHAHLTHPVPHGGRVDFEVKVRAPPQPGPAPLGFEMVVTDRVPFGAASEVLEVEVVR